MFPTISGTAAPAQVAFENFSSQKNSSLASALTCTNALRMRPRSGFMPAHAPKHSTTALHHSTATVPCVGATGPRKRRKRGFMPRTIILAERCKGCLLCTTVCPVKILRRSTVVNGQGYAIAEVSDMSLCTGCGSCALICPDMAIRVFAPEKQERGA